MNQAAEVTTPVVMLGSGHHGGLGIARSLGRLGVPVYSIDAARWEPAFSSRYCRGRFILNFDDEPPDRAVAALQRIAHQVGGKPILIPTTDLGCIWVAENTEALQETFCFPKRDAEMIRSLCDKDRMQELASSLGVTVAKSVVPRSQEDIARFLQTAVFPVMVKATDGERMRSRVGGTKFVIHNARELTDLLAKAEDPLGPNLLIQEFIPGEDWMFDGYFDEHSRCMFGMTAKKIRRFPVNTGVTSLGICAANETVHRTTTAFMQALGYRGILDIGYRRDQRDGTYKVLDVNPRIGCTFRLFAGADGMDVARALYLDMTGQPVPPSPASDGRKWVVEDFDCFSAFRSWREGSLTLKDWMSSLRGVQEAACFAIDDPLPFLMMAVTDCCQLYQWTREQAAARKESRQAQPVLLAPQRRS
jgi:predicted ATP-grasp superfamily ATP-dependent carboligase